jgi:hypothetical protein
METQSLKRFEYRQGDNSEEDLIDYQEVRKRIEAALQNAIIEWLPDRQARAGLQINLLGVSKN